MPNHLLTQFNLHQRLYNNVLEGFTDSETNRRPFEDNNVNHVKYLAGHLLNSQYGLAMIAGLKPEIKWNDLFAVMENRRPEMTSTIHQSKKLKMNGMLCMNPYAMD